MSEPDNSTVITEPIKREQADESAYSVIYRAGNPTLADYQEAITALLDAMRQMVPDGANCSICHDGGHQAFECHHNPLLIARKYAAEQGKWRCFHCSEIFTDYDAAQEHFGRDQMVVPACLRSAVCPITLHTCIVQQKNEEQARQLKVYESRRSFADTPPQLRLGELINLLIGCDPKAEVRFDFVYFRPDGSLRSYRGHYEQLALGYTSEYPEGAKVEVNGLLGLLRSAIGKTFEGWKGGSYRMHSDTPMWVADSDESGGTAIVGVRRTDADDVVLLTAKVE